MPEPIPELPVAEGAALAAFVEEAKAALATDLSSIVLYGSGAEGKLRPTSDVNVILVLTKFDTAHIAALREPMRVAQAAARVNAMLLLESEIADAVLAFSEKFADVIRRRRILFGRDPFASITIPRAAQIDRLRQSLLNTTLRLRQQYLTRSLREEQLALVIADAAGPLRAAAATLLALETPAVAMTLSSREALAAIARTTPGAGWEKTLALVSQARETARVPPGEGTAILSSLLDLAAAMRARAATLA